MKKLLSIQFTFEKETKVYCSYLQAETSGKQLFFPKKIYVHKDLVKDSKKELTLTIEEA